jgi:hypothetical protein
MMKPPRPGEQIESLFDLGERCLREEVGLEPEDYGSIHVSWVGYYAPTLEVKVFAHVRTVLPESAIEARLATAHSLYEIADLCWLPLDQGQLTELIKSWRGDALGRRWSDSVPLAAQELWRMAMLPAAAKP